MTHRLLRSGWPPALAVALFAVVTLLAFEAPPLDIARYAGYLGYGLVLPGTLLWRAMRGAPRSFVEDVAAGTALGYAVELLVYLAVSAFGVPALVAAWPAVVLVAFAAVPSLRRHWRVRYETAFPAAWYWAVAGIAVVLLGWLAFNGFLTHPLDGPGSGSPYVDMPYHLALAAELKHHFPPKMPFVIGQPLSYHWFVHAHLAASSWTSGVELHEILYRFAAVPLAVLTPLLVALLAARASGRIWAGPVAAALTVFVGYFSPYAWTWDGHPAFELNLLTAHIWASPTQNYGLVLFLPLVLLLVDRLRDVDRPSGAAGARGQWAMIVLLLIATMGGKATFLPLLLAGVGVAGLIGLAVRRRIERPLWIVGVLGLVGLGYATQVLFGGDSATVGFDPKASANAFAAGYVPAPPAWFLLLSGALAVATWTAKAAGVVGILARRERWADPVAGVLAGIVLGGVAVSFLFGQLGGSQLYFARSMAPFLAILSAWGAAALVPPDRANRRVAAALLGSALLGGAIMTALVVAGPERPPSVIRMSRRDVALALVQPYLAAVLVVGGIGLALVLLRRRYAALRGISAALVVALVLGLGLTRLIPLVRGPLDHVRTTGGLAYVVGNGSQGRPIAPGGVEAARWLRDHSDPDDVVATNTHCRDVVDGRCGNRHFWVAAYTERRILVEGWGYTPSANRVQSDEPLSQRPFWRPDVLAENDRAFTEPTRANLDRLRDRYGVRWLFVDDRYDRPAPELDDVARLRFRAGNASVYQVP